MVKKDGIMEKTNFYWKANLARTTTFPIVQMMERSASGSPFTARGTNFSFHLTTEATRHASSPSSGDMRHRHSTLDQIVWIRQLHTSLRWFYKPFARPVSETVKSTSCLLNNAKHYFVYAGLFNHQSMETYQLATRVGRYLPQLTVEQIANLRDISQFLHHLSKPW